MRSYDYENPIYIDVDGTLIFWEENYTQPHEGSVEVQCPHDGEITHHKLHKRHIRFLKKQMAKGIGVVVWSAQGVSWAKAVARQIGLEDLDIMVMGKPKICVDDLKNANEIIPSIIYLHEDKYSP